MCIRHTLLVLAMILLPGVAAAQRNDAPSVSAQASRQSFVSVSPEPKSEAWWLRAEFHPFHTEVRGIPVAKLDPKWCKATEFSKELIPSELIIEHGTDTMAESGLAFAVEGFFDRSRIRQTAVVGAYQTCAGQKGTFLLILDPPRDGARKVRFIDKMPGKHQFAALKALPDASILILFCMECDNGARLQWNKGKGRFTWLKGSR